MSQFFTLLFLVSVFCAACVSKSADVHMISEEELSKELNDTNVIILDVRTPDEYQQGHILHAKLLNMYDENFKEQLASCDKNKTYVVYCASHGRSAKAAKVMMQEGFQKVYNLKYGFNHWEGKTE
ncbi:MAG: rhodanese-like domain-containing protein [Chitinophagales bacterium]|nr:rhodanese-like domain-containing protein [Chitinophagales bacterium]